MYAHTARFKLDSRSKLILCWAFLGKVSLKGENQGAVPLNKNGHSKPNGGLLLPRFSKDGVCNFSLLMDSFWFLPSKI